MEISSTPGHHPSAADPIDPAADLDLLDRAQSVVDVDQILDFGPWWYAPLLAALIGGLTLFGQDVGGIANVAAGVVGVAAGIIVAIHDHRRRAVRLRGSARSAGLLAVIVVLFLVLIGSWGTAVSSLGYERFVPGYAVLAWLLTSMTLLGVRAGFHALRRRRPVLR